jgi:hypothetical protein
MEKERQEKMKRSKKRGKEFEEWGRKEKAEYENRKDSTFRRTEKRLSGKRNKRETRRKTGIWRKINRRRCKGKIRKMRRHWRSELEG